jgi:hypothetical protein
MPASLGVKKVPKRKQNMKRDRLEIRADPGWIARLTRAAERFGLSLSAFIRMVVSERMEELERNPPAAPEPPTKKGGK